MHFSPEQQSLLEEHFSSSFLQDGVVVVVVVVAEQSLIFHIQFLQVPTEGPEEVPFLHLESSAHQPQPNVGTQLEHEVYLEQVSEGVVVVVVDSPQSKLTDIVNEPQLWLSVLTKATLVPLKSSL